VTAFPPQAQIRRIGPAHEWLYARSQALARAQSHYLLLLLLVARIRRGRALLGGRPRRQSTCSARRAKALVEAGAVSILSVVTLGFFGAAKATELTYTELGQLPRIPELGSSSALSISIRISSTSWSSLLTDVAAKRGGRPVIGWFILILSPSWPRLVGPWCCVVGDCTHAP